MRGPTLRIIDANLNRAREGLRVVEDFARFVRDDARLCSQIKPLRHALTQATQGLAAAALPFRDTAGDVGTDIRTAAEQSRPDAEAAARASAARVGEALRVVAEYAKVFDPEAAAHVESIRYRFYDLERDLFARPRADRLRAMRLYVLVTESSCRGDWHDAAEAALAGGADVMQLREKSLESGPLLERARRLVRLCHDHGALCVVNDRPDVALLADADGVHLGQQDLSIDDARKLLGTGKIVGRSTHTIEQARLAEAQGADYIGVGPIYLSPTKPREVIPGLDLARAVAREVSIPAVAIAGITRANAPEVFATGIRAVAVTAAVMAQDDVRKAAEALKAQAPPL